MFSSGVPPVIASCFKAAVRQLALWTVSVSGVVAAGGAVVCAAASCLEVCRSVPVAFSPSGCGNIRRRYIFASAGFLRVCRGVFWHLSPCSAGVSCSRCVCGLSGAVDLQVSFSVMVRWLSSVGGLCGCLGAECVWWILALRQRADDRGGRCNPFLWSLTRV